MGKSISIQRVNDKEQNWRPGASIRVAHALLSADEDKGIKNYLKHTVNI